MAEWADKTGEIEGVVLGQLLDTMTPPAQQKITARLRAQTHPDGPMSRARVQVPRLADATPTGVPLHAAAAAPPHRPSPSPGRPSPSPGRPTSPSPTSASPTSLSPLRPASLAPSSSPAPSRPASSAPSAGPTAALGSQPPRPLAVDLAGQTSRGFAQVRGGVVEFGPVAPIAPLGTPPTAPGARPIVSTAAAVPVPVQVRMRPADTTYKVRATTLLSPPPEPVIVAVSFAVTLLIGVMLLFWL